MPDLASLLHHREDSAAAVAIFRRVGPLPGRGHLVSTHLEVLTEVDHLATRHSVGLPCHLIEARQPLYLLHHAALLVALKCTLIRRAHHLSPGYRGCASVGYIKDVLDSLLDLGDGLTVVIRLLKLSGNVPGNGVGDALAELLCPDSEPLQDSGIQHTERRAELRNRSLAGQLQHDPQLLLGAPGHLA